MVGEEQLRRRLGPAVKQIERQEEASSQQKTFSFYWMNELNRSLVTFGCVCCAKLTYFHCVLRFTLKILIPTPFISAEVAAATPLGESHG